MARLVWTLPDGEDTARWTEDTGGGGGSLPDWWTVDSTPDAEQVTFGGSVFVDTPVDQSASLLVRDSDGIGILGVVSDHSLTLFDDANAPIVALNETALSFGGNTAGLPGGFQYLASAAGFRVFLTPGQSMTVLDSNFAPIFRIDEADGSVHIKTGTTIQADL